MYKYHNPYLTKNASALPDTGKSSISAKGAPVDKSTRIQRMLDGRVSDMTAWIAPEDIMSKHAAYVESMRFYPGDRVMRKVAAIDPAAVGQFLKNNWGRIGMGLLGLLLGAGLGRKAFGGTGLLAGGALGGTLGSLGGGSVQNTEFGKNLTDNYIAPAIDKAVGFFTPKANSEPAAPTPAGNTETDNNAKQLN